MRSRLFWILSGGLAVLGSTHWIVAKKRAKWGWALAGIYILGPSLILLRRCLYMIHRQSISLRKVCCSPLSACSRQ